MVRRSASKKSDEIRGTPEFKELYNSLDSKSYLRKIIKKGLDSLRENIETGEKIGQRKWPKTYVEKYRIRNLFKLDLNKNQRLTYTVIAEDMKKVVCIIETMDHNTYNRRFSYR